MAGGGVTIGPCKRSRRYPSYSGFNTIQHTSSLASNVSGTTSVMMSHAAVNVEQCRERVRS